jgi:site-specific recombinase XerC
LDGSTNRDSKHEKQRAKYWVDLWGPDRSQESHRKIFVTSKRRWLTAAIFSPPPSAFRRVLTLAVQDGKLNRNPMKGVKFLPEPQKDRFFSDDELLRIRALMTIWWFGGTTAGQ